MTSGDVVTRLTDTADATDNTVNASVSATKKGDCAAGTTVAVKVDDLQEMYNHFEEQLTAGLGEMAKKQGTNGMPKAPDTSTKASDVPAPKPDADAAKTLKDQQAEADKTESDVKAGSRWRRGVKRRRLQDGGLTIIKHWGASDDGAPFLRLFEVALCRLGVRGPEHGRSWL